MIVKLRHLRMTAAEIAETLSMPLSTVSAVLTSRLAYADVLPDERATTAAGFLRRALAFFARYGIRVERVLTDNGSAYVSTIHAITCRTLGIRHLRTRPRRPQTNGKPNASFAPFSQAGPTARSTGQASNAPQHLTAGFGTTTIDADTQPSATKPRSAEPTCLGPTANPPAERPASHAVRGDLPPEPASLQQGANPRPRSPVRAVP